MNLKGRHFLKLLDYTPEEIEYLVNLAADLKYMKKKGVLVDKLRGKNVALIFEKTSTRPWYGNHIPGSQEQPDRQEGEHRRYSKGSW